MSHLKKHGIFKLLFFSLPSAFWAVKVQTRNIFRLFSRVRNSSFHLFSSFFFSFLFLWQLRYTWKFLVTWNLKGNIKPGEAHGKSNCTHLKPPCKSQNSWAQCLLSSNVRSRVWKARFLASVNPFKSQALSLLQNHCVYIQTIHSTGTRWVFLASAQWFFWKWKELSCGIPARVGTLRGEFWGGDFQQDLGPYFPRAPLKKSKMMLANLIRSF